MVMMMMVMMTVMMMVVMMTMQQVGLTSEEPHEIFGVLGILGKQEEPVFVSDSLCFN